MVGLSQSLTGPGDDDMGRFRELFMDKFYLASARHAKEREFLELKQGSMTVLKYIAKFTCGHRYGQGEEV